MNINEIENQIYMLLIFIVLLLGVLPLNVDNCISFSCSVMEPKQV